MNGPRGMLMAAGLLGLVLAVYWPGLNGPLILDDLANLDVLRILDAQGRLSLLDVLGERGGILGGRPVSWATFVLNWRLAGDDVWTFKLVNLLIHLFNGLLVLALSRALLAAGSCAARGWEPWLIAGIWLLMPMQVSTVLYVVQRMAMLSAFFTLLGLLLYVHGRLLLEHRRRAGTMLILASVVLCWPLATLSKQNGVLLMPLLLVVEFMVFSAPGRAAWPRRLVVASSALMLTAGMARALLDPGWIQRAYALRDFSLTERFLTQPRVLVDYALNALQVPGGTALGLFHDDFPVSTSLFSPPSTLPALAACVMVPVLAWRLRRSAAAPVLLGLLFFLVAHALEAGPFALEIYFEHRNYLPAAGLSMALVCGAALVAGRLRRPGIVTGVLVLMLLGFALLTATRVSVWTTWEGIVRANAAAHPASPRARAGAAVIAFTAGDLEAGLGHLRAVRESLGEAAGVAVALKALAGHCLAREPPPGSLLQTLAQLPGIADDPYTLAALRWYRTVVDGHTCPGLDVAGVADVLDRLSRRGGGAPGYGRQWMLHDELAAVLAHAGRVAAARMHLEAALQRAPASRRPALQCRLHLLTGDPGPAGAAGVPAPAC